MAVTALELIANVLPDNALVHVAHQELLVPDELMTGIEIPRRGDGEVFRARAAARDALIDAGTVAQIEHVVIEGYGTPLPFAAEHSGDAEAKG